MYTVRSLKKLAMSMCLLAIILAVSACLMGCSKEVGDYGITDEVYVNNLISRDAAITQLSLKLKVLCLRNGFKSVKIVMATSFFSKNLYHAKGIGQCLKEASDEKK